MEAKISVPQYELRGFSLWGFRDMAHCMDFLFDGGRVKQGTLVAMNAEKILKAEEDPALHALLDEAEYKYADGISMVRSIRRKYPAADVSRVAGADLWEALMQRAGREGTPVFPGRRQARGLGGNRAKAAQPVECQPRGQPDGYFKPDQREALLERIRASGAAIVTVAMGSPKQEILMRDCRKVHPQALYMGVGGTYDVFTGHVKRAPKVWQNLGLEWLYRLLSQPSRIGRQLKLLKFVGYYYSGKM